MKFVWKDNQRVWRNNKKDRHSRGKERERERWVGTGRGRIKAEK